MSAVFIPRQNPRGRELNYFDMIPSSGFSYEQTGKRNPLNLQNINPPPLSRDAFHRPNNMIVYSAKEVETKRIVGKTEPVADGLGQRPINVGRGKYNGLDNTGMYKRDSVLTPIASSFNSSLNNRLGQPA